MLPRELGGVVDPTTLKVYGTTNLRIVDASVMPLTLATHPQSTIYAIAERVSLGLVLGHSLLLTFRTVGSRYDQRNRMIRSRTKRRDRSVVL